MLVSRSTSEALRIKPLACHLVLLTWAHNRALIWRTHEQTVHSLHAWEKSDAWVQIISSGSPLTTTASAFDCSLKQGLQQAPLGSTGASGFWGSSALRKQNFKTQLFKSYSIAAGKATPGIYDDGMSGCYKNSLLHWKLKGTGLETLVKTVLNRGRLPKLLNTTDTPSHCMQKKKSNKQAVLLGKCCKNMMWKKV